MDYLMRNWGEGGIVRGYWCACRTGGGFIGCTILFVILELMSLGIIILARTAFCS